MERIKVLWCFFLSLTFLHPCGAQWPADIQPWPPWGVVGGWSRALGSLPESLCTPSYWIACFQHRTAPLQCPWRIPPWLNKPVWISTGSSLPTSISWSTEELHKHKEEILIKFGLVKSIPDNPHNTKTNSILLVVIQKKGHSHLSFVH